MQSQRLDIFQKLQLYKIIKNLNLMTPNYSSSLISSIVIEAWGRNGPRNGAKLVKKYLQNHFTALAQGKSLQLPKICEGYGIIAVSMIRKMTDVLR